MEKKYLTNLTSIPDYKLKKNQTLGKLGMEGNFFILIKDFYKKNLTSSYLVVKDKCFLSKSGQRQGCLLSLLLFDIALKVPEKEIKGIQNGKEEAKLSLFTDKMIISVENLMESIKRLLELINEFIKFAE